VNPKAKITPKTVPAEVGAIRLESDPPMLSAGPLHLACQEMLEGVGNSAKSQLQHMRS